MDMNQHFTYGKLARFTAPTIGMMLVMSAYVMIDGYFVSNWAGATALAAVNFVFPLIAVLATIGFMLGTGGTALVAATLGEGRAEDANRQFSLLAYAGIVAGIVSATLAVVALKPTLAFMGLDGELLALAMRYGVILCGGIPFTILQYLMSELAVAAGRPNLSFAATVVAGLMNAGLDALLIAWAGWGVTGAAIGTVAGEAAGGLMLLAYFARPNPSPLRLGPTRLDWPFLRHTASNGSSEMVSNIASSLVSTAYNMQLLKYLGEAGVAAYSTIMYVGLAFAAILMGFIAGSDPLMSFHYGAGNRDEMRSLFRKAVTVLGVGGLVMFGLAQAGAAQLAHVFVGYDASLEALTVHAMRIYALALIPMGLTMYGSGLFTALGNGVVSAMISFVRTIVFEIGAVFALPLLFGAEGIWWSVTVAEVAAFVLAGALVVRYASRYGFLA